MHLPVREVWLHHSVTTPTGDPRADWRAIQRIGFSRDFADISYSFGFHPDGTVLEGRGLNVGAHTLDHNASGFGLVLIGDYRDAPPTEAQIQAVREWISMAIAAGWLEPRLYPTGGHRDVFGTECPGDAAYDDLARFREPLASEPVQEDDMPRPTDVTGKLDDPISGGYWLLTFDGGVRSYDRNGEPSAGARGASFFGSYPALPQEARQDDDGHRGFYVIKARSDGRHGYELVSTDGGTYAFP